jgi:hypothetical protein
MTRRTQLSVRFLEDRTAPSGVDIPPLLSPTEPALVGDVVGGRIGVGIGIGANAAPVISGFRAIVGPNGQVTFTGKVTDDTAVAGYVVRITGPGVDVTAIVEADGTFRVTTTAAGVSDITVSATTTDSGGLKSSPAYTTFTPTP